METGDIPVLENESKCPAKITDTPTLGKTWTFPQGESCMPLKEAEALEPVLPELLGVHSRDPGVPGMLILPTEQQHVPCSLQLLCLSTGCFGDSLRGGSRRQSGAAGRLRREVKTASLDAMEGHPLESQL